MGNTNRLSDGKGRIGSMVQSFGLPRLIIAGFLLLLFILAPFAGVDLFMQITNVLNRFSWNAVMVLAMVPMIHAGCGPNFGLPLGVVSGLLGATLSIELGFTGAMSFVMAILISTPFALLFGGGYGWLLNKIKGGEMMIATYVGFSAASFMCMMWLLLPYSSPTMVWGLSGQGLRTTISLEGFYNRVLSDFLQIRIGQLVIPTGALLFFALGTACWMFPLLSRFEFSLGGLLRTAIQFFIVHLPSSLLLTLLLAGSAWACAKFLFPVFFLPCTAALAASLLIERAFLRHMPQEERAGPGDGDE